MSDSSGDKKMVGGYGSDDTVEIETGYQGSGSQIPGILADVSTGSSTQDQAEPLGPAGALEFGSHATDVDNLSGDSTDYTSGGGMSGFGKGS